MDELIRDLREQLAAAEGAVAELTVRRDRLRAALNALVPPLPERTPGGRLTRNGQPTVTRRVVSALDAKGAPMTIGAIMRATGCDRGALSKMLGTIARNGGITRVSRGVYAPAGWQP